jgi:hypothetical protein
LLIDRGAIKLRSLEGRGFVLVLINELLVTVTLVLSAKPNSSQNVRGHNNHSDAMNVQDKEYDVYWDDIKSALRTPASETALVSRLKEVPIESASYRL